MAASSLIKISKTESIVEEQLSRLTTSSEATTTTSSSLCNRLSDLKDLHESFNFLLQFQLQTIQALKTKKTLEQVLDGSLGLLDSCSTTRDILSMIKQTLQDLQSSLRRKRGFDSSGLENEVNLYMLSKKKLLAKMITKCLKNVMMTKAYYKNNCHDLFSLVEEATCEVFRSLLAFISPPKTRSLSSRSLALKLFRSRKVACEGYIYATQLEKIDATLMILKANNKDIKIVQVKQVLKELESLESTIQELDNNLECIFRCLLKTRVSLLNLYTHE
ncbi:hypothetical protein CsatB_008004 [Cannabis sativa]|uniref:Uncharacterized protein n=1 Tax=Cannabis sativa TaxID=3483 RepID=A0A7J6F753_CANSA|nr:uncharacterized protein LOC115723945 [Cannabis sativa]KAF4366543.1 hypothetical protein G4B88_023892 [Cannabis sativa]KAF4388511.1 hypothetical protein F8388_012488 [Cannabis sativa]